MSILSPTTTTTYHGAAGVSDRAATPSHAADPWADLERAPGFGSPAVRDAVEAIFGKLRRDRGGAHWCAELEGDSILSSEYLLMKWILAQETDRPSEDPDRFKRICNHLRLVQRSDGTWGQYPDSDPDVSACVKAYFVLKLFGDDPDAPHMRRARERILELGGADACNTFSTFFLACLGQVDWDACPAIPPEIVLLPRWFPFHMDKVAAWTRTMILPLAICSALRPVRAIPSELGIDELFIDKRNRRRLNQRFDREQPFSWTNFFLCCDRLLKSAAHRGLMPKRAESIARAERWLLERLDPETTEGLGAIFPPMVYIQIAFQAMGYERSHPVIVEAERQLDAFIVDEPNDDPALDHVRIQPCFSPVWDTGISLYALTEAGLTIEDDRVRDVCDWLLDRQVRLTGDWVRNLRKEDRSLRLGEDACAWAFEYRNDWYPDVDDTAMIAKAMFRAASSCGPAGERYVEAAIKARRWIVAMQNDDGGWAAFDRTKDRRWMEAVPFADHNAMQDPSCSDITGRTIESLIACGIKRDDPAIQRAVSYLLQTQEAEGCWIGRWGVNYLYGTWQAMGGLSYAFGDGAREHAAMRRACEWVLSVQNADGGFGETANSYIDPSLKGLGPSTASQTAWGLMCLQYVLEADHPAVERAAGWLRDHQLATDKRPFEAASLCDGDASYAMSDELSGIDWMSDLRGGWGEHLFTGTGFPQVFYLRYNMYRHYFPLMALARFDNMRRDLV